MSQGSESMALPADAWLEEQPDDYRFDCTELKETNLGARLISQALAKYPKLDIKRHLDILARYGFDPKDPDIIRRAVKRSVDIETVGVRRRPNPAKPTWYRETRPVVYYMRLGNRIKIGTTVNLSRRLDAINPEELVTLEWGDHAVERQRHRQFAALRCNGEWFKMEEPLLTHLRELDSQFRAQFGTSLSAFTIGHRLVTGFTFGITGTVVDKR